MHLIGKDILTTHCVYWPTMLKAAGLSLPRTVLAHGWWNIQGSKMSKSRGSVVKPLELTQVYGVDAFRYFLLRDMTLGRDADFSEDAIAHRYQGDLVNDLQLERVPEHDTRIHALWCTPLWFGVAVLLMLGEWFFRKMNNLV